MDEFKIIPFTSEECALLLQHASTPILKARREVLHALACRKKIQTKLPLWFHTLAVQYPESISLEQCSSEITAAFKAELVQGESLLDLTGGFGVDDFYFAKHFNQVVYVEEQKNLKEIATYNFQLLGAASIECHQKKAEDFLNQHPETLFDVIYLDPARRNARGQKTVGFEDCSPNVLQLLPQLLQRSKLVLLKTSPILDIPLALTQLKQVATVYIVSVQNECKEILFLLNRQGSMDAVIHAVDLYSSTQKHFSFTYQQEKQIEILLSLPLKYIYEPNASIMKAGGFKSIAHSYNLAKLHANTHLYTSNEIISDFPGRCFEVLHCIKPQYKLVKTILPELKANLILRNFPGSASTLQKQLKVKDGGDQYLLAFTDLNQQKMILHCTRHY